MEILGLKFSMKTSLEELNSRLEKAEEIISKAESKLMEILQPEEQKEKKRMKKTRHSEEYETVLSTSMHTK